MKFIFALPDKGWGQDGGTRSIINAHKQLDEEAVYSLISYYHARKKPETFLRPVWL